VTDYSSLEADVAKFRKGSPNIAAAFDDVEKILKAQDAEIAALQPDPPPPPPPPPVQGYTYFDSSTWSVIANPPWTSIQTDLDNGGAYSPGTGATSSPSGHIAIVAAPDGNGKALRAILANSDPPWPPSTDGKRSQVQMSPQATWNGPSFSVGDVIWIDLEFWIPTGFDVPRNNWFTLVGLHPNAAGVPGWGCFDIGMDDNQLVNPIWLTGKLGNGNTTSPQARSYPKLVQLTNSDGSIYMPNRNRRIRVTYGGRMAPDSSGWYEGWVDGVNVVPRLSGPTMWTGDTSTYFKFGPYMSSASSIPSGSCTIYLTMLSLSSTRPF
jgi:hypothetical protein